MGFSEFYLWSHFDVEDWVIDWLTDWLSDNDLLYLELLSRLKALQDWQTDPLISAASYSHYFHTGCQPVLI